MNHTGHPLLMALTEAEMSHPQLATTWLEQGNRSTPNHLPPCPASLPCPEVSRGVYTVILRCLRSHQLHLPTAQATSEVKAPPRVTAVERKDLCLEPHRAQILVTPANNGPLVLRIEPRVLYNLGKCSTPELQPQPSFQFFRNRVKVVQVDLELTALRQGLNA